MGDLEETVEKIDNSKIKEENNKKDENESATNGLSGELEENGNSSDDVRIEEEIRIEEWETMTDFQENKCIIISEDSETSDMSEILKNGYVDLSQDVKRNFMT